MPEFLTAIAAVMLLTSAKLAMTALAIRFIAAAYIAVDSSISCGSYASVSAEAAADSLVPTRTTLHWPGFTHLNHGRISHQHAQRLSDQIDSKDGSDLSTHDALRATRDPHGDTSDSDEDETEHMSMTEIVDAVLQSMYSEPAVDASRAVPRRSDEEFDVSAAVTDLQRESKLNHIPSYLLIVSSSLSHSRHDCIDSALRRCCGYTMYEYVPQSTWIVAPHDSHATQSRAVDIKRSVIDACSHDELLVKSVLRLDPKQKIDSTLTQQVNQWSTDSKAKPFVSIYATLLKTPYCADRDEMMRRWQDHVNAFIDRSDADMTVKMRLIDDSTAQITLTSHSRARSQIASHALIYLSHSDCVLLLDSASHSSRGFETHNLHATRLIESGRLLLDDSVSLPLKTHGVTARGVIIATGDTGIAYNSCFFADSHRPVPLNTFDFSHRKIVTYQALRNKTYDAVGGHGTHTAASAAGSIDPSLLAHSSELQRLARYAGTASDARLAIFDFNDGLTRTKIKTPRDIYNGYLKRAHDEARATISTNRSVE